MPLVWGPLSSQSVEGHFSDFLHLSPELEGGYLPGLFLSFPPQPFPSRPSADPLTFSWCWAAPGAFGMSEEWNIKELFSLLYSQHTPLGEAVHWSARAWCIRFHTNDGTFLSGLGPCKGTATELCWIAVLLKICLICSERKTTQVGLKLIEEAGKKNCRRSASKRNPLIHHRILEPERTFRDLLPDPHFGE